MSNKRELSIEATEFIPKTFREEAKLFDELEKQFVDNNKWLFEYDPLVNLKTENDNIDAPTIKRQKLEVIKEVEEAKVVEVVSPTWADVVQGVNVVNLQ
jgi:hypothetical protein